MGNNTWISEKDNKIHIKKPKLREAIEKEITLKGNVIQEMTKKPNNYFFI